MRDRGGSDNSGWSPNRDDTFRHGPVSPAGGAATPTSGDDGTDPGRRVKTPLLWLLVFLLLLIGSFVLLLAALVTGMAVWAWASKAVAVLAAIVLVGALARFVVTMMRS